MSFDIRNKLLKLSKSLFFILVLLLPVNLGLHFVLTSSYVSGLLVDYLIPTLYIQDILVLFIILFWIFGKETKQLLHVTKKVENRHIALLLIYGIFVFLSVLVSSNQVVSLVSWVRLVLYIFLVIFMVDNFDRSEVKVMVKILGINVAFLGILSFFQFINQSSVFNNYLILGEQPYYFSNKDVVKENVLGFSKVPAYGLFRHPNILGGYLSLALILVLDHVYKQKSKIRKNIFTAIFLAGFVGLFLSLSLTSWVSFLIGLFLYYRAKKTKVRSVWAKVFFFIVFLSLFLPLLNGISFISKNPSFYRRSDLLTSTYTIINKNPIFGVGYNNLTSQLEKYGFYTKDVRFNQPVHNIFVLTFVETGVFAFGLFLTLLLFAVRKTLKNNSVIFILLLQILFLGSLDHYLVTIHQTQLLFWIVVGLSFI